MEEPIWIDVTDEFDRMDGGERHVRNVNDHCWVSVLHRLTGFGYMEWETAICSRDPETNVQTTLMVRGDRREELSHMNQTELERWYDENIEDNRNSFETLIAATQERGQSQ